MIGRDYYSKRKISSNLINLEFDISNMLPQSELSNEYKFELLDNIDLPDDTIDICESKEKLYPVYILLMHTGTALSTAIKTITKSNFSHCSISFDSSLTKMYSFGRKADVNPFIGGFKEENIHSEFFMNKDIPYALYMVPVSKNELQLMKNRVEYFVKNSTKFKYDFTGLFKNYLGISDNPEYKWFCSRFVSDILNAGKPANHKYVNDPFLMRPEDFTNTTFGKYIIGGKLSEYNKNKVDRITFNLLVKNRLTTDSVMYESKYADMKTGFHSSNFDSKRFKLLVTPKDASIVLKANNINKVINKRGIETLKSGKMPDTKDHTYKATGIFYLDTKTNDIAGECFVYDDLLADLNVISKYRGNSIGNQLVKIAKQKGGHYLGVHDDNKVAMILYIKNGFKEYYYNKKEKMHYFSITGKPHPGDEDLIKESSDNLSNLKVEDFTLYHGSNKKYTTLKAHVSPAYPGEKVVYATPSYEYALAFAGGKWSDLEINQTMVDDNTQVLTEIFPGMFDKYFNCSGYIHYLHSSGFHPHLLHPMEHTTPRDVKPYKVERVPNVLKALEKSGVQLYRYPELPPFIYNRKRYIHTLCDKYGEDENQIFAKYNINEAASRAKSGECDLVFLSSRSDWDKRTITPRIPDNYLIRNGFEDATTPRVCFSTSIGKALRALSQNLNGMEFYVYIPNNSDYKVITPTKDQVPDVELTNERWVLDPVILRNVGKIKVLGDVGGPGLQYSYGNGQVAELFDWKWVWVSKTSIVDKLTINETTQENVTIFMTKKLKEYCDQFNQEEKYFDQIQKSWKKNSDEGAPPKLKPVLHISTDWQLLFLLNDLNCDTASVNQIASYWNLVHNLCKAIEKDKEFKSFSEIHKLSPTAEDVVGVYVTLKNNLQETSSNQLSFSGKNDIMKNIIELNNLLNTFKYGIPINHKIGPGREGSFEQDFYKYYKISNPEDFIKHNGGVCWDYATYEAWYFKKYIPVSFTTWYIVFSSGDNHTFLTFQFDGKYYYFESSYKPYRGIYMAKSEKDIINFILDNMNKDLEVPYKNLEQVPNSYGVFKYNALDPKIIGMGVNFQKYILDTAQEINFAFSKSYSIAKLPSNINEGSSDILSEKLQTVWFTQDGLRNSLIFINGKNYRERVETLIIKNINGKPYVYLAMQKYGLSCPGGSTEPNKENVEQAIRECQEEAFITPKNLKYITTYKMEYGDDFKPSKYMQHLKIHYDGMITHLYIGEYSEKYTGKVDPKDLSKSMASGHWYEIHSILNKIRKVHKEALVKYLSERENLSESSIELLEMVRSELASDVFGIPELRKYPMPDAKHVISAVKMFNHVTPAYEKELAKNIMIKAKKFGVDLSFVGPKNRFKKYYEYPELLKGIK